MKNKKEDKCLPKLENVIDSFEEVICRECGYKTINIHSKFDEEIKEGVPIECKGCKIIDDLKKNIKIALKDKEFVQSFKELIKN